MRKISALLVLIIGLLALPVGAQKAQPPLTEKEVLKLLKKYKKDQMKAAAIISERTVSFDVTEDFTKQLQKGGADMGFFRAVVNASPTGRSFKTPLGKSVEITPEEKLAFIQVQNELDPATQLKMVADFEQKFPNSPLLSYALAQAARLCQQQGDFEKTIEYGERSIKLDADNLFSLVIVALMLPQPRMLQGSPAENERKLATAESYASRAIELAEQIPADLLDKDEQMQRQKASVISDAHGALGMVNLDRDDYARAAEEFKAAIASATAPNPVNYYRLGEAYENDGKIDLAIEAFQNASNLSQGTAMKGIADKKLAELRTQKGTSR